MAILQQCKFYTVVVYLARFCYVYIVPHIAKQQDTESFGYNSGHDTHASKCLKGKMLNQWCMHGRNTEKIQVMKKELIIKANLLS